MSRIITLLGATATGKTGLAHELAEYLIAHNIKTAIISADSRVLYQDMNIGTATPESDLLEAIQYYQVNTQKPSQHEYSLGQYIQDTQNIILNNSHINTFIMVGGTGLYFKYLLTDIPLNIQKSDIQYINSLQDISNEELYASLPEIHRTMHQNDRQRIIRKLELINNPESHNIINNKLLNNSIHWFGLKYPNRDYLRDIIKLRTQYMLENNLIDETQYLIQNYGNLPLFQRTIGYAECLKYLNKSNTMTQQDLAEQINISTSQYAKRQETYFRGINNGLKKTVNINWLNSQDSVQTNIHNILTTLR